MTGLTSNVTIVMNKAIVFFDNCQKLFNGTYWRQFKEALPGFVHDFGYATVLIGLTLCILLRVLGYEEAKKGVAVLIIVWLLIVLIV